METYIITEDTEDGEFYLDVFPSLTPLLAWLTNEYPGQTITSNTYPVQDVNGVSVLEYKFVREVDGRDRAFTIRQMIR
jgi:hypothetical protein